MSKEKNSRFEAWQKKYSFEKSALDNQQYGEYLSSYLRHQTKPLVLNLNGAWGTGKTYFLKQLYSDLRFKHEYPVVYIDSWKSDFSNDPLLVLVTELIEQFKGLNKQLNAAYQEKKMLQVLAKFSKKAWNTTAVGMGAYLSGKADNGALVEVAKMFTFSDADAITIGQNLTDNYKVQLSAIEDTRKALQEYLECFNKDKRKVFVLIDELDRCRPTYAIEMLETIKHFFSLDNYIFVVATDTKQLSHSVKAVYGSTFDGSEYLSRFFNRTAALPEPDKFMFAQLLVCDSILEDRQYEVSTLDMPRYDPKYITDRLFEVGVLYNLSLRRMSQVFSKFESSVLYELDRSAPRCFDLRLLLQLITEYDSVEFHKVFEARKASQGQRYDISKELKEKTNGGLTNNIIEMLSSDKGHVFESLTPKDRYSGLQALNLAYQTSWEFANNFENTPTSRNRTFQIADSCLLKHLSYRLGVIHSSNLDEKNLVTTLVEEYRNNLALLQSLWLDKRNSDSIIWDRSDYIQAVELSSQVTNF
ncbi:P-loop NTPase fold protein [Vibrio harveyi]|uniref:KAP family P-loop NTPase fold protein n=1 Tax=Vibrio harveyi TaxID=669 RepID=UPI00066ACA2F|nr:P-loop NTPase fold protein [Vibrio harveyi]